MDKVTFNPILVTKKLLVSLDERPRNVLSKRFGLQSVSARTLESIGKEYGITRERVRQIESFALNKIRQSEEFVRLREVFDELKNSIDENGGIVQGKDFLSSKVKSDEHKPHLLFLLVVDNSFKKLKEDNHFYHCWVTDLDNAENIRKAVMKLHNDVNDSSLFSEKEVYDLFGEHLNKLAQGVTTDKIISSLIKISRLVAPNALGEWGRSSSPYIKPRGMRDYAFLVMRKHGSPMHFSEVAKAIKEFFFKPAHAQTVHNELIKDVRFVLVGRGLYALKEWGYEGGVVRNVIEKVLSDNGPLSKEGIIKKVLKERYVKENTVLVNLQNRNYFKKDEQGNYTLV